MAKKIIINIFSYLHYAILILIYFFSRLSLRPQISVLAYHSVDSNKCEYSVKPGEFHKQIEYLKRNFNILPLEEVLSYLDQEIKLPKKTVAITFDDGYKDNYTRVYPYLKSNNIPFTIFVASEFVGKTFRLGNSDLPMLTWDNINKLCQDNVTIGAHTCSHPDLSRIALDRAKSEIAQSRAEIYAKTGKKPTVFAYPQGRFNSNVCFFVRSQGFRGAFGENGLLKKNADMFALPRVEVTSETSLPMFKLQLTTAADWDRSLRRIIARGLSNSHFTFLRTISN